MTLVKIGRYEIKAELGRGGMAIVYRAYDPSFDREVAVKVLPREFLHDPQFHERFKSEIKTIAALEHPVIVPVYDVGEEDGVPYFVMRCMTGGSLTSRIERGKFSMQEAAGIIDNLAGALAYAHEKGVVHRDLKPDNILFDGNNNPFISDFGIASFASAPTNLTGNATIGTPAYMSPEQVQGDKTDKRSDIYSLGVILFQMLSGEQPYRAEASMGVALKHITDPVPEILDLVPDLPEAANVVIKTAMAKNKDARYASTLDLARAFHDVAYGKDATLLSEAPRQSLAPSTFFGARRAVVFGFISILIVAFLGAFFFGSQAFLAKPTPTLSPTATAIRQVGSNSNFFKEDFNGNLGDWKLFLTSGSTSEMTLSVKDGFLFFDLQSQNIVAYSYYTPKTYDNVRMDVRVDNRGSLSDAIVICRYNEAEGWYEFNITSSGLYQILYGKWNNDKRGASYARIANGASAQVKTGKNINDYSVTCNNRNLSLSVNGVEVRAVVDNQFVLRKGYVGVGSASPKFSDVRVGIDSVVVRKP